MKRTESEFIQNKFFDAYDESTSNTKSTLSLLGVYQLFHDENGHWSLFKCNMGIDCDKHKKDDDAEMLIESEDVFDLFRVLCEEQFNNHKKHYNKEYKYQDKVENDLNNIKKDFKEIEENTIKENTPGQLVKTFISPIDNCKFDYFISNNILSYRIDGTSNWQDFIPNNRDLSEQQNKEFNQLLEEVKNND